MKKTVYKNFHFKAIAPQAGDEENYIIRGVFSTPAEDRHGEIVDQAGWKLDQFLMNPVILFAHDHYIPAIGKCIEIGYDDQGNLAGAIQFAVKEDTSGLSETIYNLYKGAFMRAFSVGFCNDVYEYDQQNDQVYLRENTLLEISAVNVPANAFALAAQKGINTKPIRDFIRAKKMLEKGVVPFVATDMAPEDQDWDASVIQEQSWKDGANQAEYAKLHAWFDSGASDEDDNGYPDVKSAYKLPHHDQSGKVVWKGVASAMGALLGARGGTAIPEADVKGVYNHLAKHYAQFGKEAPELKEYTDEEIKTISECGILSKESEKSVDEAVELIKGTDKDTIRSAIRSLTEVLKAEGTDNQVVKGRKPHDVGGTKKIAVKTLNKAIRVMLKAKKSL